jgi:hypothetical protein
MRLGFGSVVAVVSLLVSITVAWLTLFRRGKLCMTRPVQIIFASKNARRPEIILKTLLYATGRRGHVIERLYLSVRHDADEIETFGFWSYGQGKNSIVSGGLRVGEDGVVYDHHFLQADKDSHFYFSEGNYEIQVFATVVNDSSPKLLHQFDLSLSQDKSLQMHVNNYAVLYTFDPVEKQYIASLSEQGDNQRQ